MDGLPVHCVCSERSTDGTTGCPSTVWRRRCGALKTDVSEEVSPICPILSATLRRPLKRPAHWQSKSKDADKQGSVGIQLRCFKPGRMVPATCTEGSSHIGLLHMFLQEKPVQSALTLQGHAVWWWLTCDISAVQITIPAQDKAVESQGLLKD